jgi:hypothetical protein
MTNATMALFAMHGIFAFAACMGFAVPLAIAGSEKRAERADAIRQRVSPIDLLGPLLDVWLLLEDAFPIFWLFQFARSAKAELPEDIKEARKRWDEEPSIRLFFWIFVGLVLTLPVYFLK